MPFTNNGRRFSAIRIGSTQNSQDYIGYMAIGSGSGAALVTNTTLQAEVSKFAITGSPDTTVSQKITFTGDRTSIQMSGISLREFGLYSSGAAVTGSIWAREGFASVTFDGTNELRCVYTIHFA